MKKLMFTSNLLFGFLSISLCIYFICNAVELNKQGEPYMEFVILTPIYLCLMFVAAVLSFACVFIKGKPLISLSVAKLFFSLLTIIAFSAFVGFFILYADYFILYIICCMLDCAISFYQLLAKKERTTDNSFDALQAKIAKIEKLKNDNIIDDETFEKLKDEYVASFSSEELKLK